MAINTYQQLDLKNKIREQAEQKQTYRYREYFDSCQMGVGLRGWVKKVKRLRSTNWALAGVTQWIERRPANRRVASSIPNQGTCLGCRPGP